MPTVSVNRDRLYHELGKSYTDEEFDELCFQFGLELDDITDDPEKGITFKIEIGANRSDLLCIEGISLALNVFLEKETVPKFVLSSQYNKEQNRIIVMKAVSTVRPFVVGAILRNMKFTKEIYDSFIDLQEKLHHNIARKRSLVAIGTHDLDTITGPITYDARPAKEIVFIPLNRSKKISADVLLEELTHDLHLKEFVPLIKDKPLYPVITDKNGIVLSLPPIINGNHTKISLKTTDVLIECTATDQFRAQVMLDTLVCMFSKYCAKPYEIEPVMVEYEDRSELFPKLEYKTQTITTKLCNDYAGVNESAESISKYLNRMSLRSIVLPEENKIQVEVPPIRYDILHEVDIVDDFCVSYGFNRLAADKKLPSTATIGDELEINYLSDKIRLLLSQNNYTEAATFTLCAKADIGEKMRIDLKNEPYVEVGNPKTTECEVIRTTLLPGLLKTICTNKHVSLPIRLFEVADIVLKDDDTSRTSGVGTRNELQLCAVNYNVQPGMEVIHGLLDTIMMALKIPHGSVNGYYLKNTKHDSYFAGLTGAVMIRDEEVGILGVLHPEVITNFSLNNPAAALTLNLQRVFDFSTM